MRKLSIGVLGGLTVLLGFVSAATAETTISLIRQATGSSVISNPTPSSNIVLDVFLNGDSDGTVGGGLTVDYGTSGAVTVVSFTSNPDDAFDDTLGTTTDTGSQVRNLVGFNPFGPVAINSSVRIGTITFHKELSPASATLTTLFTATDSIGGLTSPSSHGTAHIIEFATDECSIEKKCSVGGSPPQDACTASPGEEVTYVYEFITGCGLIIDDKLGVIGEWLGQPLTRTTTLTETTTNVAYFNLTNCVCIDGNSTDSVTVTVEPSTGCAATWPRTEIITIAKGQSHANNTKVSHAITGNIVDPGSLGVTAHRIEVCADTRVTSMVTDSSGAPTNNALGSLACVATGCSGTVSVTERYQSISNDGKDKDAITFIPK